LNQVFDRQRPRERRRYASHAPCQCRSGHRWVSSDMVIASVCHKLAGSCASCRS